MPATSHRLMQMSLFILVLLASLTIVAEAAAPKRKGVDPSAYLPMKPLSISIYDSNRAKGLMLIEVGLYIEDYDLKTKAVDRLPRLRDAFIRSLSGYASVFMSSSKPPNLKEIGARLQRETNAQLSSRGAQVLFNYALVRASS